VLCCHVVDHKLDMALFEVRGQGVHGAAVVGWFEALVYELSATMVPVAFLVLRLLEMYESA